MQAAIGVAQLEKLPHFVEKRIANFNQLYAGLKDVKYLRFMQPQRDSSPSWFGFLITLSNDAPFSRNEIVEFLEKSGIQTRNLFGGNMLRHPAFMGLENGKDYRVVGTLENTDKIMRDSFWVGVYPGMQEEAICFMIAKIKEFVGKFC